MTKFVRVALALVAILAPTTGQARVSAKPAGATCAPVTTATVESQFKVFNDAWASKNPDTVTALFARDAVLLATVSNTPRTNPEAIKDYFVSFLKGDPVGTINTSTIKLGCNMAVRMGTWTVGLTNQNSGMRNDVKARYTFIYAYEDGQWKIAHLHSSMMPIPAA
jgi:uncharacterized protein (TIGR02246 family)